MEIQVKGTGESYFTPNQIILNLDFNLKGNEYNTVLEDGIKSVSYFINEILLKEGFSKEDLKTRSFLVKEETKYNEVTRKYESDGFSFNQSAKLKFDYDKDKLFRMMVNISKLPSYPSCSVEFGIKDEKEVRRFVLDKAYNDAKEQALAIALAAGLELDKCIKTDFQPFNTEYISNSGLDGMMIRSFDGLDEDREELGTVFTPEDIVISETLYCLWTTK